MADLNVERSNGPSPWWWALGLLVAVVVLWALWLALWDGGEERVEPVVPVPAAVSPPVPAGDAAAVVLVPVAQIVAGPAAWAGRVVDGETRVAEVPTDRGFWVEEGGQRVFVIFNERAPDTPKNINAGQRVHIARAMVHTDPANVPGDLDPDTRQIAQGQPVFLAVNEADLHLLSPGS